MDLFTGTSKDIAQINAFVSRVGQITENLTGAAGEADLKALHKLGQNFILKTEDFFRENRKLNIGVVGQVKAGKSSFLNTLLFQGTEVLPKASTPKTATLTRMEYSEDNRIQIEYYSVEEWEVLEENALVDSDEEVFTSAREIVTMVRRLGIDPREYLRKGTEVINFDSYEEVIAHLNDYVGEDGRYTPLVKAVTLYLNKEEFKEISIVDTPGLNDPIASRTIRTKEFMEVCDVVFFLSRADSFLDKNDWALLSSQLPQKGVKKLVLIASRYDSGIRDVLKHKNPEDELDELDQLIEQLDGATNADNIPDAIKLVKGKLRKRAREKVLEYSQDLKKREASEELLKVIEQCKEPLFVSAMCCNMAKKQVCDYDMQENNVYHALSDFSKDVQDDLALIGNLEQVREIYHSVVSEKEQILKEKAGTFIPTAREELLQLLSWFREKAENRLALISGNDREQLLEQKRMMEKQINSIKADITTVFGEIKIALEREKSDAVKDLRTASKDYIHITERNGSVTKTGTYQVSTSKWYNPFSWGSSRTEHYTYQENYTYMVASDALDNMRCYTADAINLIEKVFTDAIQVKEMKRKLLNVIIQNFDMGNEKYDPAMFRMLIERTINDIEFPVVKIDISGAMGQITAQFTGEIASADDKNNLSIALANAVSRIFDETSNQLTGTVKEFKISIEKIQETIVSLLLESIQVEFNELLSKCENKEIEMEGFREYIYRLEGELRKLK